LQGYFAGAQDLGFALAVGGYVIPAAKDSLRARLVATGRMLHADAIPKWLDDYCVANPEVSLRLVALRLVREGYGLKIAPTRAFFIAL
jgi:hypothetical protein